ncbi:MAG: 2-amino-4-hydroxy-6-hydroxymethyldihydropteridine diphosphokinase [Candidatus Firestonebacteria bacterium]
MPIVYIGLGSNLGHRLNNLKKAITLLKEKKDISLIDTSSVYETQPVGNVKQNKFLNLVIKIKTSLTSFNLLNKCNEIEKRLKRKKIVKWGPRTIDLDILFFGNKIIKTRELTIPHKLLHKRKFVLVPLVEISPNLMHPVFKKSVKKLLGQRKKF